MYGAFILPWKGAWKTLPGGNAALPVPFGRLKLRVPKHLPSPGKPAVAAVAGLGQQRETKARRRAGAPGPAGAAGCRSCRRPGNQPLGSSHSSPGWVPGWPLGKLRHREAGIARGAGQGEA